MSAFNPYQALEEAVVNAMYHRDYQQHQEVEITVEPEGISILSLSGPDRSISDKDIKECRKLRSRRYRNNRLGDFLKELELTEGRCTGIPTIQNELLKNGSPRASIKTDDERSYFMMFIPVHEGCGDIVQVNDKEVLPNKLPNKLPDKISKVLDIIANNPNITIKELGQMFSFSEKTIKNYLAELKMGGYIVREGSNKTGHWIISKAQ